MPQHVRLDDEDWAGPIAREIAFLRETGPLSRASKIRALFDYLVDRSQNGSPPREVEIAQDVLGRGSQTNDDGASRVYIHRLRRRLEDIYSGRTDSDIRIALPLGEYRLVAEMRGEDVPLAGPVAGPQPQPQPRATKAFGWRSLALAASGGAMAATLAAMVVPWQSAIWREAARARHSAIWAPMFSNDRSVVIAAGDQYLFAERRSGGQPVRLIRDPRIRSRDELEAFRAAYPVEGAAYADAGVEDIPATVPRAQLYLSPLLLGAPSVRTLPASQLPAAAILSQNIVYLGLADGLGPLRAPVTAGSRFVVDDDGIRDTRTGRVYRGTPGGPDMSSPRRQYGLLSIFYGKEGNRYVVLVGTSDMGLVGLVETVADADRIRELVKRAGGSHAVEAMYQIDSQGAGVFAVRLVATNRRNADTIWVPHTR